MRYLLIALVAVGVLITVGFTRNCVKGKGDPVQRELAVAPFQSITLQGALDVRLSRAAAQQVTVEAQPNLIDLVETSVKDGAWTIRTSNCYSTDKPFIVHVAVPSLQRVILQGSGNISSADTFEAVDLELMVQGSGDLTIGAMAQNVKASVQGSGDMKLAGTCDRLTASVQGSGDIKAGGLKATNGDVSIQGSGDVTVNVSDDLVARITGSGDVKYKKKPISIDAKVSGSGSVRSTE